MFKKIVSFFLLVAMYTQSVPVYAEYLFVSSYPSGATVSLLEGGTLKKIGTTPFKIDKVDRNAQLVFNKKSYTTMTNRVTNSEKVQSSTVMLSPISFQIQFPETQGQFYLNNKAVSANLDGSWILPYGNYNFSFDKKTHALKANYKSPYMPYVAFFTTLSILSTILVGVGYGLGQGKVAAANSSTTTTELAANLAQATQYEAVALSGIGLGIAGLTGMTISAALEDRERRLRKRFELQNSTSFTSRYLSDYQAIILTGVGSNRLEEMIQNFIRSYPDADASILANLYILRARVYYNKKEYNKAENDLNVVLKKYVSMENYEVANSLLAQTYMMQKKYSQAFKNYEEVLKVSSGKIFDDTTYTYLKALAAAAKDDPKRYKDQFVNKAQTSRNLSQTQRDEIINLLSTIP